MVNLRKAYPQDFEAVYPLLCEFNNAAITKEKWSQLFSYTWDQDKDYCGYLLEDNGAVIGFIGLIFSQRQLSDRRVTFCNLSSWIVKKEYRKQSIDLVMPLLESDKYILTDFSASSDACKFFKSFGFNEITRKFYVITKRIIPTSLFAKSHIELDVNAIRSTISESVLRIADDHLKYGCKLALIRQHGDLSLIILKRRMFKPHLLHANICYQFCDKVFYKLFGRSLICRKVPFLEVLYTDNRLMLPEILKHSAIICSTFDAYGIVIPENFTSMRRSTFEYDQPRLFNGTLDAQFIDSLYSEIILLE